MSTRKPKILLLCRQAPYAGQLAKAALDIALAAGVFEQNLSVLFSGDGVWQLLPEQNHSAISAKSIEKALASFPLYGLNSIYVDEPSMARRGLNIEALSASATPVLPGELADFIDGFKQVISC